MACLSRSYTAKKAFFSVKAADKPRAMERASAFLDNAGRLRETEMVVIRDNMGNNFCGQDALLMLRNQLEEDSSDDE